MSTVFNGEHQVLTAHAMRLLDELDRLAGRLSPRRLDHVQHRQFADRAGLLSHHLRAALELATGARYASAFVLIRTALEHHLVDRLVFLASKYTEVHPVLVNKKDEEERRLRELAASRPDLRGWQMRKVGPRWEVVLTLSGMHEARRMGRSPTLSHWFFLLDRFDPFAGKPSMVKPLVAPFRDLEGLRSWAKESRDLWERYLKPPSLLAHLRLNRLLTKAQTLQVEVHYSFLSTFVHATHAAYDQIYGRNRPRPLGRYDHYASELTLLYLIVLTCEELEMFARGCRRPPAVELRDWGDVEATIASARAVSDYFWFLHGHPTPLDRINEVHTRIDPRRIGRGKTARHDPARVTTVRYYRNPLRRLVQLHRSSTEMTTGLTYRSPWERADAQYRY